MSLVKFVRALASNVKHAGEYALAGDLNLVAQVIENNQPGAARSWIRDYILPGEQRPLHYALWSSLLSALEEK